jgi:uncharacterized protein YcnI
MSSTTRHALRRATVPLVATATLVVATALPASAHVTVSSPDAAPGGYGKLVLRVPTESATASTTELQVRLPRTDPFASVSVKPLDGWTVRTREQRLPRPVTDDGFTLTKAVSTITWTADAGHGVRPGEFEEFEVSVGPFPKGGEVVVPAVQTYSDGSVVRWDEPTPASGKEPEHPAPTLELAASADPASDPASGSGPAASGSDDLARWLGGGGLALGLVAVALAATGRRRRA